METRMENGYEYDVIEDTSLQAFKDALNEKGKDGWRVIQFCVSMIRADSAHTFTGGQKTLGVLTALVEKKL